MRRMKFPVDRETETELVPENDVRSKVISIDPERMSGEPCFVGTRVPIRTLWDHLEAGDSINTFLEDFEGVSKEQAIEVLELAKVKLFEGLTNRKFAMEVNL
jgi:uncharacterized protein (DUF433 family)